MLSMQYVVPDEESVPAGLFGGNRHGRDVTGVGEVTEVGDVDGEAHPSRIRNRPRRSNRIPILRHDRVSSSNRQGVESELRYDILPWLTYDLDLSYTWAKFTNGDKVPLAPRFLAFSGITARHESGLQGRLQMRHIGRRYGIEDGSFKTPTSTLFDLFLKYIWQRYYEFFLEFQNLANTKWRAAEHVFESRLSTEPSGVGTLDSHFTPGDPFTVKGGMTIHLW